MPTTPEGISREHLESFIGYLLAKWEPTTASNRYKGLLQVARLGGRDSAVANGADAARQVIAQEGMVTTTKTRGAVHVHPLVKVEREALGVFTRCWRALGLTWSMELDGRMRGTGLG